MTETKKLLGVVCVLLILSVCAYIFSEIQISIPYPATSGTSTKSIYPPPLTPAVQVQLAASHGFQYLISYTGRGFEPAKLTIKRGETVRFTNNSVESLWIAATGSAGAVYPAGASTECGQSAFDSCRLIGAGEFWEFTFITTGTWSYKNNSDTKMAGIIKVQ